MSLKTILLVDDEESDREQIRNILHSQDYMVLEAGAYHDAMRVFEKNRVAVDLLISDISLPGKNGCDLAIALREQKADLRVLFISGHVGAEVCRFYGLEITDVHFLRKPFAPADLLERVSLILKSAAAFPKLCERPAPKTRTAGSTNSRSRLDHAFQNPKLMDPACSQCNRLWQELADVTTANIRIVGQRQLAGMCQDSE